MISDEKGFRVITGKENEELIEQYFASYKMREHVEGKIAYKGTVIGTVKIILSQEDIHKINKGDIFVTNMTTSNMTVAMRKAAGFVTDEGGITCHACIIAREMKKPCIIGTQDATKVFKDGDLVKLDNGKISLIER